MNASNYDVIVVGAGCAGLTAAIGLARAGFAVAVIEAAAYPGAENWSGCVYFCENLVHPDILGPEGVEALAWERRLVERGFFACDGHGLLGMTYRDPAAFRHCYTVLRPIFDHHMAQVAMRHGAALLGSTTAESLIRDAGRVVGVCTNRGPLYADLVFLAEGDASHLVTREGYERFADQREAPKFLQGIKQVIELPPGAIEERFGVGPEQGVAYEMLLRNGSLRGQSVQLNMGGFLYTNRQSLSVGLVLPAANLQAGFGGDPNLLLEWFENLPALRPWLQGGRRAAFGAKIIRGGGSKDIPHLIDNGLAIGGAASAVGIDFPYPNFTGPATAMGLLLTQAAVAIRAGGGRFTRDLLRRHYLEPLQQTHYWQDVEFLRRWPGYVKKTHAFFGRHLDLALGTAYVWTRPKRWVFTRWTSWLRMIGHLSGPTHWPEIQDDLRHLSRALRLRTVVRPPALGRLLLDGTLNALRDLFRRPRANVPPAGEIHLHYSVAGGAEPSVRAPAALHRWFGRFKTILASAARTVYANDAAPLAGKLQSAVQLLVKQVNVLDLIGAVCVSMAAGVSSALLNTLDRLRGLFRRRRGPRPLKGIYQGYERAVRQATDLTPALAGAAQHWEERLGQLAYETVRPSHIHVLWPRALPEKNDVVKAGLWHVCPAHVYEARQSPLGQLQIVVNFENCIKCETCWRTSPLADWGRDGRHRFVYPVHSPVITRLLADVQAAALARPALPRGRDWWAEAADRLARGLEEMQPGARNGLAGREVAELTYLLAVLDRKLVEFDQALEEEPRTIDRARAEYLEMLARYAHQVTVRLVEVLRGSAWGDDPSPAAAVVQRQLLELATATSSRAEERSIRTWDQRYAWAAADGRQLRWHYLAGLHRYLQVLTQKFPVVAGQPEPLRPWLRAEEQGESGADAPGSPGTVLDRVFPPGAWREVERQSPLTPEQDSTLRDLLARVPVPDPADLPGSLHPPVRKALLAELGRRDPSLAYRAASHLWARDLARLATVSSPLAQQSRRWARGDEWACFAALDRTGGREEALFVPAGPARSLLLLWGERLRVVPLDNPGQIPGLGVEPLATLGLRGAGLVRITATGRPAPDTGLGVDPDRLRRIWSVLSAADLTSIAFGMADQLCRRTVAHATSRVQFPGLFLDEEARDPIGKFGAVKKMVAEMAAARYLIQTLDHTLVPVDFSASSVERARLVKAVVAEVLGTAPGSLSYNAGQVFGGTGYSEDDVLAKFYRDAAAWRFLGPGNRETYQHHGEELLRHWRPDGQRLARLRDEAQLFEELAQRKALQAELDEVRVLRSRLRALVGEWQAAFRPVPGVTGAASLPSESEDGRPDAAAQAEVCESLGRQDAHLLASKALLLRTHARLEHGLPAEVEAALVRVWLDRALAAMDQFEGVVKGRLEARRHDRPVVEPGAAPPVTSYADFLAAPNPYDSGDFLCRAVDLARPRYVPEMNESDPDLAARNQDIRKLLLEQFGPPRDGLIFERHIERRHRPDAADLDFCRRHGFFRMPIPPELGGEGRRKVDYYLLTTNAQRLADVAISLTIQANTSIGTTPVLLARDKDLPKAQKDLGPFVGDTALQQEIADRLQKLLTLLGGREARRIAQAYRELQQRLEETVFARAVLKSLAHRFVDPWQQAGRAGLAFDLQGMRTGVQQALAAWKDACAQAAELHTELARRREACDLFLRWVAAGQISAFALTEPSAGSDTARVATRARLRSVPVEVEPDGVLRFVPEGGKQPRYLLDARRLVFRPEGVGYRWSDQVEPAVIHFDEYDYETDDPKGMRYYEHGKRRVHFTDVAQLRERAGRSWYDYYELTGAKMWITNGRMAGVMCLYAKTEQGVTGFIVDRHAEGLVVGKDEEKLGQCGSPTNELSLQSVRVPRENVLGLEGRGQVNALETLNVGRAGLAMSAMAQMPGLIEASRTYARQAYGALPDWVQWRLQRMEEDCFTAEALAHDVIGRFEHPQTRSARMESAISKMLVSELLHRVIETAEEVHGLAGQTTAHLVEKRKRDARVLNIYEGTNEVQRFSILKDLAAEVAPRWRKAPAATAPHHLGREALELEALKGAARQRVEAALDLFGQDLWQNPNLQANCFLLAEVAAWLAAAESTLGRLAWLSRQGPADEAAEPAPKVELGERALARCGTEVRQRLRRFDEELTHLRRGFYAPEVRAAGLLFDQLTHAPSAGEGAAALTSKITRPFSILVVVEPSAAAVPHPYVVDGRLLEAHRTLTEADRSALETALRIRDQAEAAVAVTVIAAGPRALGPVLREPLSLGVDRARLLLSEADAVTPDSAAVALGLVLANDGPFDLILGGVGDGGGEEGQLTRLTAEALRVPYAGSVAQLAVRATAQEETALLAGSDQSRPRVRSLPAAVGVEAGLPLRTFTTEGYLAGLNRNVEVQRWPRAVEPRPVFFGEAEPAAAGTVEQPRALQPEEAGRWVLQEIGVGSTQAVAREGFAGPIQDVDRPVFARSPTGPASILAVVATDGTGQLRPTAELTLRAARLVARVEEEAVPVTAVVVPPDEALQRQAVAQLRAWDAGDVVLLPLERAAASDEVRSRLLAEALAGLDDWPPAVVGEPWTEQAFARLGSRAERGGGVVARAHRLGGEEGRLLVETSRARGKLRLRHTRTLAPGRTCWISLAEDAEVGPVPPLASGQAARVERWAPPLERLYARGDMRQLLEELKQDTGLASLADADFIIDVGFGVGNRDGYEAVIEPLERALRDLGVQGLMIGGSRKVTEELHLLPADRQIGQSGVSVNPRVILAIGVSGAPQHLNYIGPRARILAFNRDPEAPLMTLNQRQPQPKVYPVVGDLFETVPALTAALRQEAAGKTGPVEAPAEGEREDVTPSETR
jgi:electron transfer flavoprotein-quinone oxidoreductase